MKFSFIQLYRQRHYRIFKELARSLHLIKIWWNLRFEKLLRSGLLILINPSNLRRKLLLHRDPRELRLIRWFNNHPFSLQRNLRHLIIVPHMNRLLIIVIINISQHIIPIIAQENIIIIILISFVLSHYIIKLFFVVLMDINTNFG
jgi:hypothetical protein